MDGPINLPALKSFDVASFVGGVVGLSGRGDFPAASIDAYNKIHSPTDEDLWTYRYDGHITWMVGGDNAKLVEQQAKGIGGAFETYMKDHFYHPYADGYNAGALPFSFIEFGFVRTEFMGAANTALDQKGTRKLWVDGGRMEVYWLTSEQGTGQHR